MGVVMCIFPGSGNSMIGLSFLGKKTMISIFLG